MPVVRIPSSMRHFSANRSELTAEGDTLGALLVDLERQCPGIRTRLLDDKGEVRRFLNIYVGDQDIRYLQALQTPLRASDEVSIIPAIAGG